MDGAKVGDHAALFAFCAAHAGILSAVAAALAGINGTMLAGASAHAYRVTQIRWQVLLSPNFALSIQSNHRSAHGALKAATTGGSKKRRPMAAAFY
jgi:hypothetical protein